MNRVGVIQLAVGNRAVPASTRQRAPAFPVGRGAYIFSRAFLVTRLIFPVGRRPWLRWKLFRACLVF